MFRGMARRTVRIPSPADFNLRSTVRSHGWSDLPPFDTDRTGDRLAIRLGRATATVSRSGPHLRIVLESAGRLPAAEQRAATAAVRSCLRLDLDLAAFWDLCRKDPELKWAHRRRAGRLLRAPTVWQDAVMILATTNCSWALTRRILAALAERWGQNGALPTKERLARVPAGELRRHGRLGYRAPYLAALARGPDLEGLRTDPASTAALYRRLLELPGFGPYAAGNLLRLLGRFEHLALDAWVKKAWEQRFPRRRATESAIARRLDRHYGEYRGLAFWLLVTEPWYGREAWRL
jgi:N-glycosylase/DNA lyase